MNENHLRSLPPPDLTSPTRRILPPSPWTRRPTPHLLRRSTGNQEIQGGPTPTGLFQDRHRRSRRLLPGPAPSKVPSRTAGIFLLHGWKDGTLGAAFWRGEFSGRIQGRNGERKGTGITLKEGLKEGPGEEGEGEGEDFRLQTVCLLTCDRYLQDLLCTLFMILCSVLECACTVSWSPRNCTPASHEASRNETDSPPQPRKS